MTINCIVINFTSLALEGVHNRPGANQSHQWESINAGQPKIDKPIINHNFHAVYTADLCS